MSIDYVFLRRITVAMQESDGYIIDISILMETVRNQLTDNDDDAYVQKLFGHLLLLRDSGAIETLAGHNMGLRYDDSGKVLFNGGYIRMTASGYDLAKMLSNTTMLGKLKSLSITAVGELARICATAAANNIIK